MTYLLPNRRRREKNATFKVAAVVFCLLAVLFLNRYPPEFLNRLLLPVAEPIWNLRDAVAGAGDGVYSFFTSKSDLLSNIRSLQLENSSLKIAVLSLQAKADQNEEFRKLGGRSADEKFILAAVLSRPPISPFDTFIIDAGEKDGAAIGDKVAVENNLIIGDITEVWPHTARVSLFSTPGRETMVQIGYAKVEVPARGVGAGAFEVNLPKSESASTGDAVVIPGIDPKIFGSVVSVESQENEPFQLVRFGLPVNMNAIRFVSILQNK